MCPTTATPSSSTANSVWLRIARVGPAFAFHASTDGAAWSFVRHFALDGDGEPSVGFAAQSPKGDGCSVTFEQIAFDARRLDDLRSGDVETYSKGQSEVDEAVRSRPRGRLAIRLSEHIGSRRAVAGSRTLSPTPARPAGSRSQLTTAYSHCLRRLALAGLLALLALAVIPGRRRRPLCRRASPRRASSRTSICPDRDGVRARRPALRRRAGRPSARGQERDAARDAVRHPRRRSERRARPARRRVRPGVRLEPLRLRLLHGDDAEHAQPRQPLHRVGRRGRGGQRAASFST